MKRTFHFGKIDYGGPTQTWPVEVTVELQRVRNQAAYIIDEATNDVTVIGRMPAYWELSFCGTIYKPDGRNIACFGQCLDDIAKCRDQLSNSELFDEIYALWKKWNLHSIRIGTPEQEAAVNEWRAAGNKYDYDAACEMLKEKGLYKVNYTGLSTKGRCENEPHTYGYGQLVWELPADVIIQVKHLIKTPRTSVA